jgi:hypothetical protein
MICCAIGIAEPAPLEHRGFEHRRRRVGIVFQELGGALAVVAQVEPPIEAAVAALPARRDEVPEPLRDGEPLQDALVRDGAGDQFAAHAVKRRGRGFEFVLDLLQAERVISSLVPIGLAVLGMEHESDLRRRARASPHAR